MRVIWLSVALVAALAAWIAALRSDLDSSTGFWVQWVRPGLRMRAKVLLHATAYHIVGFRVVAHLTTQLAWSYACTLNLGMTPSQAPVIAVLSFGFYCVIALAYGVATFRSCPEEYELLQQVRPSSSAPSLRNRGWLCPLKPTQYPMANAFLPLTFTLSMHCIPRMNALLIRLCLWNEGNQGSQGRASKTRGGE